MKVKYIVVGQQECVGKNIIPQRISRQKSDSRPTNFRCPSQELKYKKQNKNKKTIEASMKK